MFLCVITSGLLPLLIKYGGGARNLRCVCLVWFCFRALIPPRSLLAGGSLTATRETLFENMAFQPLLQLQLPRGSHEPLSVDLLSALLPGSAWGVCLRRITAPVSAQRRGGGQSHCSRTGQRWVPKMRSEVQAHPHPKHTEFQSGSRLPSH